MKLHFWLKLSSVMSPLFFALGILFLILFYVLKKPGSPGETSKKPMQWIYLSAGAYVLSILWLGVLGASAFFLNFPDMGDFSNVSRIKGSTIVSNDDGAFIIANVTEVYDGGKKYPYHSVMLTLKSLFKDPVMIKGFKVMSRMDHQELAAYRCTIHLPLKMDHKSSAFLVLRTKVTQRIQEHAKKENQDDYGPTAYLSILSSEGKLPGIPLHFENPKTK